MRSGWRIVGVVLALLAAFTGPRLWAEAPSADLDPAAREQLKKDVKEERFEAAETTLENWRRENLQRTAGKTLLDDKAPMSDLQKAFNDAVDAKQYGVAQYYLEQIRTKAETPNIFAPALDLTIWTIVIFLLLLAVLYKFAWKPMMQGLQKREHDIHAAVNDARTAREEAQRLREEIQAERNKIEDMRRDILLKAQADAQRLADEMAAKAKAEIQAERDRARRDLEVAHDQALKDLYEKTVDLAALVSAKAIRRQLTPDDHRRFMDEALAEIRQASNGRKTPASV